MQSDILDRLAVSTRRIQGTKTKHFQKSVTVLVWVKSINWIKDDELCMFFVREYSLRYFSHAQSELNVILKNFNLLRLQWNQLSSLQMRKFNVTDFSLGHRTNTFVT